MAAFVPEKKGAPGQVRVFKYPNTGEVIASRSLFRAQTAQMLWNRGGTGLLLETRTDVDRSGKSYYGSTALHFLSTDRSLDVNVPIGTAILLSLTAHHTPERQRDRETERQRLVLIVTVVDKDGPVHECCWSPDGSKFIVIYGCILYV